ncbi:MAG: hypothetical protein JWP25_5445 [Bradyrhizobium sp.]|nr:hypothetical protein [Bradyrhizobium sp.]
MANHRTAVGDQSRRFTQTAVQSPWAFQHDNPDIERQIEPAWRRHVVIEHVGDRGDECLKIHVGLDLSGESFDDRVFYGIPHVREIEYVLYRGRGPAILRRVRVCSQATR